LYDETLGSLGSVTRDRRAIQAAHEAGDNLLLFIFTHDMRANAEALRCGSRILSAYVLATGVKIWIITEAENDEGNRAATTLLLPEEY